MIVAQAESYQAAVADTGENLSLSDLHAPSMITVERAAQNLTHRVERIARRVCSDPGIREDVSQTTILKIYKTAVNKVNEAEEGNRHSYLETAVRRVAMSMRLSEARHRHFRVIDKSDEDTLQIPDRRERGVIENLIRMEQTEQLQLALKCLTAQDRNMLTAFLVDGETAEQIGERLGLSRDVVFNRLRRMKTELGTRLHNPNLQDGVSANNIIRLLEDLTPIQREAFCLVDILGFKKREVDRALGLRIGTTDNRVRNVHDMLYRQLGKNWPDSMPELRERYSIFSKETGCSKATVCLKGTVAFVSNKSRELLLRGRN